MTKDQLIRPVDAYGVRTIFREDLDWPHLTVIINGTEHTMRQVAGRKGLDISPSTTEPTRVVDTEIGGEGKGSLIIFGERQWRDGCRRRGVQLDGANVKPVAHDHRLGVGQADSERRRQSAKSDLNQSVALAEFAQRMGGAFDSESETVSVQVARLMNLLYSELVVANGPSISATIALARLLFFSVGDDTGTWCVNMFGDQVKECIVAEVLDTDLRAPFEIVGHSEKSRAMATSDSQIPSRYMNEGLYPGTLNLPPLSHELRDDVVAAGAKLHWGPISSAIIDSIFQVAKGKDVRRAGGVYYTSEENILKTIDPLFLDEYRTRLQSAWDDRKRLVELHNDLGRLRIMDPACGCGNFLIVAYREMRALELALLKRLRDLDAGDAKYIAQSNRAEVDLDVKDLIEVTVDHFYGIEIEEWPVRIAGIAMMLVDHIANQAMEEEFGLVAGSLPTRVPSTIKHSNALRTDWATLVAPSDDVIIVSNPPFSGRGDRGATQTADQKYVWGARYNINLDYVTCWYLRTVQYFGGHAGRWAFVSTNSVCQGESVATLWRPILDAGWRCRFAHRSFQWSSEVADKAAVYVSIVGFDRNKCAPQPILWTYLKGAQAHRAETLVTQINPYLIDGPNILVEKRARPLASQMPNVSFGSMPNDGGNLLVEVDEYAEIAADPFASMHLRRFIGAKELVHDRDRWCLWLVDADSQDIAKSNILRKRVDAVRLHRSGSASPTTSTRNHPPHLFGQIAQPKTSYLAIPRHVSEHRRFYPAARYEADVICGDANFLIPDPDGFALAIVSSSMFMVWQKAIGGRIKSDLRFSKTFTYNTFPLPMLSEEQYTAMCATAAGIFKARAAHPGWSLAQIYECDAIPEDVVAAHLALDDVLDSAYGGANLTTEAGRRRTLFCAYAALTGEEAIRP